MTTENIKQALMAEGGEKPPRSLMKKEDADLVKGLYLDTQAELLARFKLPPTSVETHYVVLKDSKWTLCKRAEPIRIYEDDDGKRSYVAGSLAYPSMMMGGLETGKDYRISPVTGNRIEARKPKYDDAGRLGMAFLASEGLTPDVNGLETGEVSAWRDV